MKSMGTLEATAGQGPGYFRKLEGHLVGLALADGSRLDGAVVVSAGHGDLKSLWLEVDGVDVFVEKAYVLDVWETGAARAA